MNYFILGIVTGIVLATVGFNGIATLGNHTINTIQNFALSSTK